MLEYSPTVALNAAPTARQTLNPELLAEMVRGALLSQLDADNKPEQRAALEGFVTSFHAAADVHAQRLHLEAIGHPDFCGGLEEKSARGAMVRAVWSGGPCHLRPLPNRRAALTPGLSRRTAARAGGAD